MNFNLVTNERDWNSASANGIMANTKCNHCSVPTEQGEALFATCGVIRFMIF